MIRTARKRGCWAADFISSTEPACPAATKISHGDRLADRPREADAPVAGGA